MHELVVSLVVYRTPVSGLEPLFRSLDSVKCDMLVVVVDNFGDSELASACASRGYEYIDSGGNVGFGAGHNKSLSRRLRDAPYQLVVNPDITFGPGVLEGIVAWMDAHPGEGLLMPRILYPDGSLQRLAKLLPTPAGLFLRRFMKGPLKILTAPHDRRYQLSFVDYSEPFHAPNLSGCFMFMRSSVLERAGLFDERYFMYMEDLDLCRRMGKIAGTVCVPEFCVCHEYDRGSYSNPVLFRHHLKSAFSYFNKWGWFFDRERRETNKRTLSGLEAQFGRKS